MVSAETITIALVECEGVMRKVLDTQKGDTGLLITVDKTFEISWWDYTLGQEESLFGFGGLRDIAGKCTLSPQAAEHGAGLLGCEIVFVLCRAWHVVATVRGRIHELRTDTQGQWAEWFSIGAPFIVPRWRTEA